MCKALGAWKGLVQGGLVVQGMDPGVLGLLEVMGMGVGVIQGCLAPQGGACKTDWHGLTLVLGPTSQGMACNSPFKVDCD